MYIPCLVLVTCKDCFRSFNTLFDVLTWKKKNIYIYVYNIHGRSCWDS